MKIYRTILAVIVVIAIGAALVYCFLCYEEQKLDEKGLLVRQNYAEYSIC